MAARKVRAFLRKKPNGGFYEGYWVDFEYRRTRVHQNTFETTRGGVDRWVRDKRAEIDREVEAALRLSTASRQMTVKEALERYWVEHLSLTLQNDTSKVTDRYRLSNLQSEPAMQKRLEDLTTADVKALTAKQLAAGLAPATVKRNLIPLMAMHNMARDVWEYPVKTIAWKKVRPAIPKVEIIPPTIAEVRAIAMNAKPRLARVIMFAVLTGMRKHEIENLEWHNIRLATAETPGFVRIKGKGAKSVTLPLSSAANLLLSSMLPAQSSHVFDMKNFQREWESARDRAGRRHTRFHDLRHAFATQFREGTKDPMALQQAMRHDDIATSQIYVHADKSALLPSLERVAEKFSGLLEISRITSPVENDGQFDLFGAGSVPD